MTIRRFQSIRTTLTIIALMTIAACTGDSPVTPSNDTRLPDMTYEHLQGGLVSAQINGLWQAPGGDLYVASRVGLYHFDGERWESIRDANPNDRNIEDVWGIADDDIYAVGSRGLLMHYDGNSWTVIPLNGIARFSGARLTAVHGDAANNVWVVGDTNVLHWDGQTWTEVYVESGSAFRGVWVDGDVVIAVGENGTYRRDANGGTLAFAPVMNDVDGNSLGEVYAVGGFGKIYRWNGSGWTTMSTLTTTELNAVCVVSQTIYALGRFGTVVTIDGFITITSETGFHSDIRSAHFNGSELLVAGEGGFMARQGPSGWEPMYYDNNEIVRDVHGATPSDVYAVGHVLGDDHFIRRFDGFTWTDDANSRSVLAASAAGSAPAFPQAVWAVAPDNIVVVGSNGLAMHSDGATWTIKPTPTDEILYGVWGSDPENVFAVGQSGVLIHYDGEEWSELLRQTSSFLFDIWGTGPNDYIVVGSDGFIGECNGTGWRTENFGIGTLRSVAGVGATRIAVGDGGLILRRNLTGWEAVEGVTEDYDRLSAVWVTSNGHAIVTGNYGLTLAFDRVRWQVERLPTFPSVNGIWGTQDEMHFVGQPGTFIRGNR